MIRQRLLMSVEEHGGGAQLIRVRAHPRFGLAPVILAMFVLLTVTAALSSAYLAAGLLGGVWATFLALVLWEASVCAGVVAEAVEHDDAETTLLERSRKRARRWRRRARPWRP